VVVIVVVTTTVQRPMASTMAQSTPAMAWRTVRDGVANNMAVLLVFSLLMAVLPQGTSRALVVSHPILK
jgi:hypothetical protein